jgi:hypothetical protein
MQLTRYISLLFVAGSAYGFAPIHTTNNNHNNHARIVESSQQQQQQQQEAPGRLSPLFMGRAAAVRAATKNKSDARKAKTNAVFGKRIIMAVKQGGGPDPNSNRMLGDIIRQAKANSVPVDVRVLFPVFLFFLRDSAFSLTLHIRIFYGLIGIKSRISIVPSREPPKPIQGIFQNPPLKPTGLEEPLL